MSLSDLLRIGTWTTPPESAAVVGDELHVTAVEGSDAWRHTLYAALNETKALAPDAHAIGPLLEQAANGAPDELAPSVHQVSDRVREHLSEVEATDGFIDPFEFELPPDLVEACAETDNHLDDVPYPAATVPEVCGELHRISQYQDLEGLELVVDFSLHRARTYTPPEIEDGARAFSDRMETVWDEQRPEESPEDEAARLALGERCEAEGWLLLQPS